jgi:ComF family protein
MKAMFAAEVWKGLLGFVYPPSCVACDAPTPLVFGEKGALEESFCPKCVSWVCRLGDMGCSICGHPEVDTKRASGVLCGACRDNRPVFRRALSVYVYEGSIRKALHRFKYRGDWVAGRVLQGLFAEGRALLSEAYDWAVPVPLHEGRLHERGFQQAWCLQQGLGLNCAQDPWLLERWKETESQARLGKDEREKNLRSAIRVREGASLMGARVLLVDDVFTTGATANACAAACLEAGAAYVDVLTLCRAV